MSQRELEKALLLATRRAGTKVLALAQGGGRRRSVGFGASGDKTLLADKEAENEIIGALSKFEDVRILSEEAGWVGNRNAKKIAIVDPLDGSSNFERGIPFFCTSVAMADDKNADDVTLAVVRDIVSRATYIARRGEGSTKAGRPIETSSVTRIEDAVIGVDMSRSSGALIRSLAPLIASAKRQVHLGANALELCYLAEGRIDAFIDLRGRIRITDVAGSYLIAKEAGAAISDADGGPYEPSFDLRHGSSFVASANRKLHKVILELCRPLAGER